MKSRLVIFVLMVVSVCVGSVGSLWAESQAGLSFGHISYVDKGATVIRQDGSQQPAEINLPVAPGDQIFTGATERCEIQFDNGTVLRLDKNTSLTITTIAAPTLTSSMKITTMNLNQGQIYAMIQSYNKEMFQVMTPHAAIEFKKRSAATIRLLASTDTFLFVDKGKCAVKYGEEVSSVKTETAHSGKGYLISETQGFTRAEENNNLEFVAWNDYVNRNFQELHAGVSNVPKKIYRFNKGLVYWAEKWSSLYGEWIYDDLFGYVWKPADEIFSFSKRPFFHANFTRINGQVFVVPQQAWGWVPAHMGTWVWMRWGWTWVPGNTFSTGISQYAGVSNCLEYWVNQLFGSYDLYYSYHAYGEHTWRNHYRQTLHKEAPKVDLKRVPESIRVLIHTMNKTPLNVLQDRLGNHRPNPVFENEKVANFLQNNQDQITKKSLLPTREVQGLNGIAFQGNGATESRETQIKKMAVRAIRDFNPDMEWAQKNGHRVYYSSKLNAMVCGNLNMDSQSIKEIDRRALNKGEGSRELFGDRISLGNTSVNTLNGGQVGVSRTPVNGHHETAGKEINNAHSTDK